MHCLVALSMQQTASQTVSGSCNEQLAQFTTERQPVLRPVVEFSKTSFKHRSIQIKGNFAKLTSHLYFKCLIIMLVYYFLPFIVNNRYLLFQVSSGHNSVTVQNRTIFLWTFLLRITHTIISQSSADSSWITLYMLWYCKPDGLSYMQNTV